MLIHYIRYRSISAHTNGKTSRLTDCGMIYMKPIRVEKKTIF